MTQSAEQEMRKEFLKAYVMSLVAEGHISTDPATAIKNVIACVKEDFPAVMLDIGGMVLQQGIAAAGERISDMFAGIANAIGQPDGLSNVLRKTQRQYANGTKAMCRVTKRR